MKMQTFRNKIAGLLILAMIISCMAGLGKHTKQICAADTKFIAEQLDIGDYASSEKAPKPTNEQYKDWLFAGWYEDEDCTQFILDKTDMLGNKYAKFVPAEVLSVKCQNLTGTSDTTGTTSMRVVTTVDSVCYREVGFDIQIGSTFKSIQMKTVYKKIVANEGGVAFSYEPSVFSNASAYFATVTLTNIPNKGFKKGIYMKPYWITLDGTKVYGLSRYARVEDSWLDVLNVPVRLYTNEQAAAGCLKVSYNKDEYQYIGTDTGDIGDVFQEMYVRDNGNGIVSCVGNAEPIGNVTADGLLLNLRFQKIGSSQDSSVTFSVSGEDFVDYDGNAVYTDDTNQTFDVSDVVYNVISQ